ncbi:pyridoxamine 5'-phosphate oxidase family protein [uncultured Oscillibacter sp.]|uniref:pyridoxamine 5'-phosphate oxidase family protein n=1 Tax=uncultured Oscillibacter sp. TaxID=876091 RepID=UPI0025F70893|nr:pyridoxamine 5'-phosphate oxidase family protein [uncultured Oscillibacter sp.]
MRAMRRKDREVTDPGKIREIIAACDCCRLGLCEDGRAYIVPLDFGFTEQSGRYTFYFHSAKKGRKIDLIRESGWASFEMDAGHQVVSDEIACEYTARFQCVMGGGPVTLLETAEEKRTGLTALMEHTAGPGPWTFGDAMVDAVEIIRLEAEELSCKVLS